ncbi:CHASE2 domain-containing protein [Aetokthonos hydrillicola Thurmond2011]|jgi:CHASE2 domain-containing sensor protein|uniref:CHASE2 domain-containing protein n=1 Tax=Aetokthonos hydrillicola Thurmond2011 TaxID=2712845 RepID=A0AAP5MB45_9CYAN|nr:CHASE2 domain-containing protein [Aetokthonos hydrillicola]MBO3458833.1 CHASE2 domain-containing protein [Aetokthonos hydrillicola CCALA 1050]MBW4587320.1 CHASE2 domain-containing protein [Aetokthonos hydrillicola CCALA 1050]MDR9896658.1 CHASE2 domain-containing protein [Aetokthonos hydrillicola Thurmond2011]
MTQIVTLEKIKETIANWRVGVLPGIIVIALVIILRSIGSMQFLEWQAFDSFLGLRLQEPIEERVLIVGINENDIRSVGVYPIPDKEIAFILKKIHSLEPRVIGVDIFKDLPVEPGHTELLSTFKEINNLIAIEKVLPETIAPPPVLPSERVCFADQVIDSDGKLRRSLLLVKFLPETYKTSLSLCLAKAYLSHENISLETGFQDTGAIRFGNTELPRFVPNFGGYVHTDAGGVQILLNFRSGRERFRMVTLGDIKTGNFDPSWIRDRIVIIGMTAPSVKDFITTSAITSTKPAPGRVYGVEIQAHAVSQIISAVLNSRPLLKTWSEFSEYLWIIGWGVLGINFACLRKSPFVNFLSVGIASTFLILISYVLLTLGLWVPVIPTLLVFVLNGVGLMALYQYDQVLQSKINSRQAIIERTFEMIHNGPLQTLAKTLKYVRERNLPTNELLSELEKELEKLNYELRGVYEFLQAEPLIQDNSLYLGRGLELDLRDPIQEVLYQVYLYTLQRDFPCFKTIKIKIRSFDPIDDQYLNLEQKQGLCRFLEEALCNVGKHAIGVTRLEVSCKQKEGFYTLSILDNGSGINSSREGQGTQQFKNIAKQLNGNFRRFSLSPHGTLCELSWPVPKYWW